MSEKPVLLVVEDDPGLQRQLKWAYDDYELIQAGDREAALEAMRARSPDVVTLDLGLPPDPDGVDEGFAVLEAIMTDWPHTKVIVASGHGARESARRAVALGAFDFYQKPIDIDELGFIVRRAFHVARLEAENRRLSQRAPDAPLGEIVTAAPEMLRVCAMVERGMQGEIIYEPVKLAVSGDGRIYLEVRTDIYKKRKSVATEVVRLIESRGLSDKVDWQKVAAVIRDEKGVAEDIALPELVLSREGVPPSEKGGCFSGLVDLFKSLCKRAAGGEK